MIGSDIQDPTEDALVVAIEQPSNTCETGDAKNAEISQDCLWPWFSDKGQSTLQSSIAELR